MEVVAPSTKSDNVAMKLTTSLRGLPVIGQMFWRLESIFGPLSTYFIGCFQIIHKVLSFDIATIVGGITTFPLDLVAKVSDFNNRLAKLETDITQNSVVLADLKTDIARCRQEIAERRSDDDGRYEKLAELESRLTHQSSSFEQSLSELRKDLRAMSKQDDSTTKKSGKSSRPCKHLKPKSGDPLTRRACNHGNSKSDHVSDPANTSSVQRKGVAVRSYELVSNMSMSGLTMAQRWFFPQK